MLACFDSACTTFDVVRNGLGRRPSFGFFFLLAQVFSGARSSTPRAGVVQVLEMLEASMTEKQLRRFLEVMVDNLVVVIQQ